MLTKENFKDTWARPKFNEKYESTRHERMPLDGRAAAKMESASKIEMNIVDESAKDLDTEMDEAQDGKKSGNLRSWEPLRLPAFSFQRDGIGVVKRHRREKK